MAATLIHETDIIEVRTPPVLVYGQPGSGKTSLAQTAPNPLTLDFDGGIHRSAFRKKAMRFDSWPDVLEEQNCGKFNQFDTIVIDTVDTCLSYMKVVVAQGKGNARGGILTQQGWGVLKEMFDLWLASLRRSGKQVVMVAHQKEEKEADGTRIMRPDIAGGSYSIVMRNADIVGYISYRNQQRYIGWDPTDAYFAKNGGRLPDGPIPNFADQPSYLSDLLVQAKANLGHTAHASAAVAVAVQEWEAFLGTDPNLEQLNAKLADMAKLEGTAKRQVWELVQDHAAKCELKFDKKAKKFEAVEVAA